MRSVVATLCIVSLIVCLVTCAFWWRSRAYNELVFVPRQGGVAWSLDSRKEGLHFDRVDPWPTDEPPELISYRRDDPRPDVMVSGTVLPVWERWGARVAQGTVIVPVSSDGRVARSPPGWAVANYTPSPPMTYRTVVVPHVYLAGLAAVPPAAWVVIGFWRRRRARQAGLCPRCGYDLRASRDRCPECGRPVDAGVARRAVG